MTGRYQDWLRRRHDAMRTPRGVVEAQLRAATGRAVRHLRRLIVGEDNEVYDATTSDGERLIVRISHAEDPRFEAERWALDAARAAGVPTPRVLLVQRVELDDGRAVTFCVEEKLPGVPLDTLLDRGVRPQRAISQLGELLAAVHGIRVDGFGYLRPDGRGWPITFASIMLDLVPQRERLLDAARHWRVEPALVDAGLAALQAHAPLYDYDDPRLLHGDLGLDHVLVDGERVGGILDMQQCAGGHPAADLAHWLAVADRRVPLSALMDSYPGGHALLREQAPLIELTLARRALWMLMADRERGNPARVDDHVRDLERALRAVNVRGSGGG